jgi:hypothetical protein
VVLSGEVGGETVLIPLDPGRHRIGSAAGNEVVVQHPSVSRWHAIVTVTPDEVMVEDLGSRNGTFVNGARVDRAVARAGDVIHLGLVGLVLGPRVVEDVEVAMTIACALKLQDEAELSGPGWTAEPAGPRPPLRPPIPLEAEDGAHPGQPRPTESGARRRRRPRER